MGDGDDGGSALGAVVVVGDGAVGGIGLRPLQEMGQGIGRHHAVFQQNVTAALCIIHKIQLLFIIKSSNLLAKFYKKYRSCHHSNLKFR